MGTAITKLVFQPPEPTYSKDPNLIWLNTSQHEVIPAFFIDRDAKFTLLFSHGNAEDLGMIIHYFREASHILEVNIFAYEYTGYGMSTGEPNELSVYADVEAAFAYLRDVIGVPWQEVILYGRSVGSGPSVHLASRTAVRAMVLQSPLLSIYRIAFHSRFTLPGDMFTNVDKIGKVRCPVYVVHGMIDEIVPFWHGEDLVRNCQEGIAHAPFWVEDGGHNDLEMKARQPFYDNFAKFLHCVEQEPVSEALMLQAAESPI
uniref:Serine aminopeptidase S33 domain-containing protein n=1 Tax=Noctiluca scintillans TaxID=2966 RepID=A0A7S0ZSA7_NOCSC|mmetsp:Transcript_16879/g.45731  ORF Transcript_16879/g.45731 Transcript_16879/m.45731 type:complete len:259 (+) Transcript_16879:77-853(+)